MMLTMCLYARSTCISQRDNVAMPSPAFPEWQTRTVATLFMDGSLLSFMIIYTARRWPGDPTQQHNHVYTCRSPLKDSPASSTDSNESTPTVHIPRVVYFPSRPSCCPL